MDEITGKKTDLLVFITRIPGLSISSVDFQVNMPIKMILQDIISGHMQNSFTVALMRDVTVVIFWCHVSAVAVI